MKKRALLLSGGVNPTVDRPRYRNDIEAYFRVLRDVWDYAETDIRLHVGPGGALRLATAAGEQVVAAHSARPRDVMEGLEWLAELGVEDRAFVMATDRGEVEGLSLWGKATT